MVTQLILLVCLQTQTIKLYHSILQLNILTIANGNTVDLSTLAGGGGASAMADLSDVDSNDTVTTGDMLLHDGSEYKFVNLEDEIWTVLT